MAPIRGVEPAVAGGDPTGGRHAFDQDAALTPIFTTLRRGGWRRPPSSPHPQRAPHGGVSSHGPLSGPRTLRPVPDAVARFRNDPLTAPLPVVPADGYDHGPVESVDPYAPASFAVVAASSPEATTWWRSPLAVPAGDDRPHAASSQGSYDPAPPATYEANSYGAAPYAPAFEGRGSYDQASYDQGHYDPAARQPVAFDPTYDRAPHAPGQYDPAPYDAAQYAPAPYDSARYDSARYEPAQYDPEQYATVLPHPTAYAPAHPAPYGPAHDPSPYIPSAYAPVHDDRHGPGHDGYDDRGHDDGYSDGYDGGVDDRGRAGGYDDRGYGRPVRYDIPRRGRRFADPLSYDPVTDSGRHHRLAPAGW